MDSTPSDLSAYLEAGATPLHGHGDDRRSPSAAAARAWIAERMIALARANGIALHDDRDLLALLSGCEWGEDLPLELYAVVARTFEWLSQGEVEFAPGGATPPASDPSAPPADLR